MRQIRNAEGECDVSDLINELLAEESEEEFEDPVMLMDSEPFGPQDAMRIQPMIARSKEPQDPVEVEREMLGLSMSQNSAISSGLATKIQA